MNLWQMKSAYTSQPAAINKILKEGFEPFWGYRTNRNSKADVRMYFRKAPDPVVTNLEISKSEPPTVQIDAESLQSFSNLIDDLINNFNTKFIKFSEALEKYLDDERYPIPLSFTEKTSPREDEHIALRPRIGLEQTTDEAESDNDDAQENEQPPLPSGEGYRVVENVPDLGVRARTEAQINALAEIRRTADTNITVGPVDQEYNITVLAGEFIYKVDKNGKIEREKNPANRNSIIVE